jgi:hypothetical protein
MSGIPQHGQAWQCFLNSKPIPRATGYALSFDPRGTHATRFEQLASQPFRQLVWNRELILTVESPVRLAMWMTHP